MCVSVCFFVCLCVSVIYYERLCIEKAMIHKPYVANLRLGIFNIFLFCKV